VATLVVYVDRTDGFAAAGVEPPVTGRDAVTDLVTTIGLADPEDATVNCLLDAVRIADDLKAGGEEALVAVVADSSDAAFADRAIARQLDELTADRSFDGVVVVTGSAESERLLPVIESRLPVDSVDRVVVRQAHDLESTYYLLKQFLADEELRETVLIPAGVALVAFPVLTAVAGPAVALATISAVTGAFLLYKGLGVDDYLEDAPAQARDALYSGQVSVVTYVVAGGLTLLGAFVGVLGASGLDDPQPVVAVTRFAYDAVPWLSGAALAASAGRLLDDVIRDAPVRDSSINLPFVAVAVGLVVRGFAGFFLERAEILGPLRVPGTEIGALALSGFAIARGARLALFIVAGVVVSLIGVRVAAVATAADEVDPGHPDEINQ
jgi:putative membrane protein